jgi:nitroimidazol reductase NimA-like FMN-containing flavoprotein (pyridoxamine 5'-phosphate oxidase superfamily)
MTAAHHLGATADADGPSPLARVRRKPDRARYDTAAVYAVLDAAPFAHVGTVRRGRPVVLPMAYGRRGGLLFLHGSRAAGLFRDAADGSPVCVTATLFDGLVLGRSARNHSMNYRSVTIHGSARPVTEPEQIIAGLRAVVDHVTPGRWEQVRKPTPAELRETALWQVAIDNASVKQRSGSTLDPEADRALQVWSGHLPARLTFGQPVPAEGVPPGTELPDYLHALRCHPLADVLSVLAFSRTRLVASWRPLSQEIP